jgi:hypothetical protein
VWDLWRTACQPPKLNVYHAKTMVELLKMNEEHHDEEVEEEEFAG